MSALSRFRSLCVWLASASLTMTFGLFANSAAQGQTYSVVVDFTSQSPQAAKLSYTLNGLTENRNGLLVGLSLDQATGTAERDAAVGLLYWLVSYKRWNIALMIPIFFAVGLSLLLGLTVANVGTLYRMRFPFAMIFVSIGMAGLMQMARAIPLWLERVDTANDQ